MFLCNVFLWIVSVKCFCEMFFWNVFVKCQKTNSIKSFRMTDIPFVTCIKSLKLYRLMIHFYIINAVTKNHSSVLNWVYTAEKLFHKFNPKDDFHLIFFPEFWFPKQRNWREKGGKVVKARETGERLCAVDRYVNPVDELGEIWYLFQENPTGKMGGNLIFISRKSCWN